MMTERADDLAYVRELAEAGQSAPILGGRFLAWWGGLVTIAYLCHYAIAHGVAGLDASALGWLWIGFVILGLGGYFALVATFPRSKPGASSAGNRVSAAVWMASGFVLFSFFAGVTIKSVIYGVASSGFTWSIPLVLGVYGISQFVSGTMASSRILSAAGILAIVMTGVTAIMTTTAELYLVAAGAAALSVFIPGILLMRAEPSETV